MAIFKIDLPYASYLQGRWATARFQIASGYSAILDGERFELVEMEDENGQEFVAIFATYDGSGDAIDLVEEKEARALGLI